MNIFAVENFRYGLDVRRSPLSSVPGTLTKLVNGIITSGAKIKKRNAFVKVPLPSGCFGLEATKTGLVTFGSGPKPAALDDTNIGYIQLLHPVAVLGVSGSPTLTNVISTCVYNDKVFAIAEFSDSRRFCYYDGALVWDSALGQVFTSTRNLQAKSLQLASLPLVDAGWQQGASGLLELELLTPPGVSATASTEVVQAVSAEQYPQVRVSIGDAVDSYLGDGPAFSFTIAQDDYTNVHVQLTLYPAVPEKKFSIYSNLLNTVYELVAMSKNASNKLVITLRDDNFDSMVCTLDTVSDPANALIVLKSDPVTNKLLADQYEWNGAAYLLVTADQEVKLSNGTQLPGYGMSYKIDRVTQPPPITAEQVAAELVAAINITPHWWPGKDDEADNEHFVAKLVGPRTVHVKCPRSFAGLDVPWEFSDYTLALPTSLQTGAARNWLLTSVSNDLVATADTSTTATVFVTPSPVFHRVVSPPFNYASRIRTDIVSVSTLYGSGSFTYTWERLSDSGNDITIEPIDSGQQVKFSAMLMTAQSATSRWKVTVLDANNNAQSSAEVDVTITHATS